MKIARLSACLAACAALVLPVPAVSQTDFPQKPVRLIVPYPPGGVSDILGRLLMQHLGTKWGQAALVENRAGAGGNLGTELGAKAPADGYTLTLGSIATAISQGLYPKLGYDYASDFAAVTQVATSPLLLVVNPSLPVTNVQELVRYAKANPGKVTFASSGSGSSFHLAGEMLKNAQGIDIVHVPYKGGTTGIQDVMGGQVQMMFNNIVAALPSVKAGKLKVLGVTAPTRTAIAPEIPTFAEQGFPDFLVTAWFGIIVPKGTPQVVVQKLNADFNEVLLRPDVRERLLSMGAEAAGNSSAEFDRYFRFEIERWGRIVKASGAKVE